MTLKCSSPAVTVRRRCQSVSEERSKHFNSALTGTARRNASREIVPTRLGSEASSDVPMEGDHAVSPIAIAESAEGARVDRGEAGDVRKHDSPAPHAQLYLSQKRYRKSVLCKCQRLRGRKKKKKRNLGDL